MKQIIMSMKKARLTEDRMSYEDLAVMDIFSDDEVTVALNREMIKEKKDKSALMKARKLQEQLIDLKKFAVEGMLAIVETVESIDENSKKILFKHFDQAGINLIGKKAPTILDNLQRISQEAKTKKLGPIDSEGLEADSSGNDSDNDEMN